MTDPDFDALKVGPGDVLVVRGLSTAEEQYNFANAVVRHFVERARAEGVADGPAAAVCPLVVSLSPGQSIEMLDPEQMRQAGWVRAE